MKIELPLTDAQTQALLDAMPPRLRWRDTWVLVAALRPADPGQDGWRLDIHALPGERRDAIRAACAGTLKLKRERRIKATGKQPA